MQSNKKPAKNLLKNKAAMTRLHNERLFKNIMTRRTNMTKIGNRASQMMVFNKATVKKPVVNKVPIKAAAAVNKKNNNENKLRDSMHAYKYLLAVPFAKTGLHDPKASNYHNELIRNMKNYQTKHPELVPMHNKEWFVNQLKRNVWALKNNRAVVSPAKNMTRCPARISTAVSKTHRMLNARKGVKKPAAKKKMTNKQLSEQLKAMTAKLRAANK